MKPLMCFCWILLAGLCYGRTWAQTEIDFLKGSYADAIRKAREEEKPMFIFAYTEGCEDCRVLMEGAFKDAEVAQFFNARFVNYKLDAGKDKGPHYARYYNLREFPALVVLNASQIEIEKTSEVRSAAAFKLWAERMALNLEPLSTMEGLFRNGTHDRDFLYSYLMRLSVEINPYDYEAPLAVYREGMQGANLLATRNWEVFRLSGWDVNAAEFQYFIGHYPAFVERHGFEECYYKFRGDFIEYCSQATQRGDTIGYQKAMRSLESCGIVGADTLMQEIRILHFRDLKNYLNLVREMEVMADKFGVQDAGTFYEWAWALHSGTKDPECLRHAAIWAERALKMDRNFYFLEVYALILYDLGRKEEAMVVAQEALKLGRADGTDCTKLEEMVNKGG